MNRFAFVALGFTVLGFVLCVLVLVARRRRGLRSAQAPVGGIESSDVDAGNGRTPATARIDVVSGYDEEHESEVAARHGATLHITEDLLSVRQV